MPNNMWLESQLMDGFRGLEHIMPTDPLVVDPLAAVPNMGVNQEILTLLQQHHQALTPDVLAHLQDGHGDAPLPVNLPTQSLAYVPCEAPACPLSPAEVDVLNQTMATSPGMASNTWEAH
ncbi:uncharacterized protein EV420DRAFT_1634184 [Desarmillaria tabescens]|uniref:Uncharacterized protein n=1 Tax=Armillaria tabescens TaxID=1929756 RepID=A0AA39NQP0_ARMTA|nr:uncharacterized protein EV420DRAFT_1634184 [Desarmillaria tabescens]KAK0469763.1 hypothetical protein EV420DRAFT_1634184 [Desarmillaria tabescens]